MPQSPETIARAFVNAINAHDVNELAKLMSEKHRFIDSLGTVVPGQKTDAGRLDGLLLRGSRLYGFGGRNISLMVQR
jgi:hypothetical protein